MPQTRITQHEISDREGQSARVPGSTTQLLPRLRTHRHHALVRAIGVLALSLSCTLTFADNVDSPKEFLGHAIQDGRAEIESCQLAERRSTNTSVKVFAKRMITDHIAMNKRIEELAQQKGYDLPDGESVTQHATYLALKPLSGSAFDKVFMKHNVSDHRDDIEKLDKQAHSGSDADVRSLASDAVQTLKALHLTLERTGKVPRCQTKATLNKPLYYRFGRKHRRVHRE